MKISFLLRLHSISLDVQNHILFLHLWKVSVYGRLHCFYLCVTVNAAAVDMSEQILVHGFAFTCVHILHAFIFIYPISTPFHWLPIHPALTHWVSTTSQAGTVLEPGEMQLETMLSGGINTQRKSHEVLGDLATPFEESQWLCYIEILLFRDKLPEKVSH